MVIARTVIVFLFFIPFMLFAEDATISIDLDRASLIGGSPIQGQILIEHEKSDEVDSASFMIGDSPLSVEKVSEIKADKGRVINAYRFQLPAKEKGLYVLPSISVTVGDKRYKSTAQAYEVSLGNGSQEPPGSWGGNILKLEAFVEGGASYYVSQKTRLGYRIYFNDNIRIQSEHLPLLEPDGFKRLSNIQTRDRIEPNVAIREVYIDVEAEKPGFYSYGPSNVVGRVFRQQSSGQIIYRGTEINASAPTLELVIKALPEEGKPASFNGAFGEDLDFKVEVLQYPEVQVGDKVTIGVTISGKADLERIPLPELCCQPGVPGRFKLSDIPPVATIRDGAKTFAVEMRPLSTSITAIPSFEFSYFNPKTERYEIKRSKAIPITVVANEDGDKELEGFLPGGKEPAPSPSGKNEPKKEEKGPWPPVSKAPGPIEIEGIYSINRYNAGDLWFGTWSVLLVIPIGLAALYIQWDYKRIRDERKLRMQQKTSAEYFEEAIASEGGNLSALIHDLSKAFLMRLYENGYIKNADILPSQLPTDGICGDIKAFFDQIDKQRFSGAGILKEKQIIESARTLFKQIKVKK